ncbi:FecR family protein [Urechidicola vernalis]|uniref:FecR family protein n=1 Tax=Urechidicola vernalis TaxID=3075600 RepID=A0ABU2Y368_9FLAO|nr:FecR family protein [Urechidicola sp. P050]MDT0552652.1 FecR family protein [Urechidicola sp. P050]
MNKEELIKKWLDDDLSAEELKEFQQLDEYESFMKLSEKAKLFSAPNFDSKKVYEKLNTSIDQKRKRIRKNSKWNPILKIAAVLTIGVILYAKFFTSNITTIETFASESSSVKLPDASNVELNAMSTLAFNKNTWSESRQVNLDGEAFFKVAKGSQFDVITSSGVVSVVGTEFSVKNRANYFEVKCFEGKVNVQINDETITLPAGETVRLLNKNIYKSTTHRERPTWMDSFSSFESVPLIEVISEFERQYNLKVYMIESLDTKQLYSGMFVHNNRDMAIKAIALPFGLDYTINKGIVTLDKVE